MQYPKNADQEAFLRNLTPDQRSDPRFVAREMGQLGLDPEVRELEKALALSQTKEESAAIIKQLLQKAGTNVEQNDADLFGDGDQTNLGGKELENKRQILRNLFASGGDIHFFMTGNGLTQFAWDCIKGDAKKVEQHLKEGKGSLEYRETSMRLSPLLLTIALSKHKDTVAYHSKCDVTKMDHIGVFRALLKFGARPDAKDVTGKTVCHYGAGVMATDETLQMTEMAIQACKSAAFFDMQVKLKGLNKTEYNGMTGTLGGFVAESQRRRFQPNQGSVIQHELLLKPDNIFDTNGNCVLGKNETNLVDIPDRLGSISLHEVAMSQRADVAEFLVKHSSQGLDVADGSGLTIRKMMCSALPGPNKVMDILKKHASDQSKNKNQCANCSKQGKMMDCSRCFSVVYCGKECQTSHWSSHHRQECRRLRTQAEVIVGPPQKAPDNQHFFGMGSAGYTEHFSYGPPDNLRQNQAFWIKVQSNGIRSMLMIYDQSRKCNFLLPPGASGHRELVDKVSQQQAFLGRKSFFKARFDEKGRCLVYLPTSAALQW